jgi:hypothetical protein
MVSGCSEEKSCVSEQVYILYSVSVVHVGENSE